MSIHPLYTHTTLITIKTINKHATYERKICVFRGFYAYFAIPQIYVTPKTEKSGKNIDFTKAFCYNDNKEPSPLAARRQEWEPK